MLFNGEKLMVKVYCKGLSVEQFADKMKVSRQTVYNWSSGTIPKPEHVKDIQKILDVKIGSFLELEAI